MKAEGEGIKPEGTRRSEFEILQTAEQRREHNLIMGMDGKRKLRREAVDMGKGSKRRNGGNKRRDEEGNRQDDFWNQGMKGTG